MGIRLRTSAAAVASAGVITGTMLVAPEARAAREAAAPPAHPVYLQNAGSGQNVEPVEGTALPGTPVIALTPDGTLAQRWTLSKQQDGGYSIVSQLGNVDLCLTAGSRAGDIRLQTCAGSGSQEWNYTSENGAARFENRRYQDRWLAAGGADGPPVLAPDHPDDADQQWRLPAA